MSGSHGARGHPLADEMIEGWTRRAVRIGGYRK